MQLPEEVAVPGGTHRASALRDLLEVAGCGLVSLDETLRVEEANDLAAVRLGQVPHRLPGRRLDELLPPAIALRLAEALVDGEPRSAEIETADGSWLSLRAVPRGDRLLLRIEDATELRRCEEERQRREASFAALVEAASLVVWRVDGEGRALADSRSFCEYTGRPLRGESAAEWIASVHPDDQRRVDELLAQLPLAREPLRCAFRLRRHDGVYRHFEGRFAPVLLPGGEVCEYLAAFTDVEESHRLELQRQELLRTLDARRERLASILEALPLGVLLVEQASGRVLHTNRAFEELVAASCPDAIAGPIFGFGPIQRAMREGAPVAEEEVRVRTAAGEERWLRMSAVPLFDPAGAVVAGLGSIEDVTARKQAELALRESESTLRFCLETIPQHVWIAAPSGELRFANQRWRDFAGIAEEELPRWAEVCHPEDLPHAIDAWLRSTSTGDAYEVKVRLRSARGEFRWFLCRALPMRDRDGRIDRWFGTNTDLDDFIRTSQALKASEARFRRIADLDLLAVVRWRLDGRVLEANREFLRISGRREEDLREGRLSMEQMTSADQHSTCEAVGAELRSSGMFRPTEIDLVRPDGNAVPVVATGALEAPGSDTVIMLAYDASERKGIEEFQHQLIGVVSHDLRSPLAAMTTTVGTLLRSPQLSPGDRRAVERIRTTADRMRRITRDLLDYTQVRVGNGLPISPHDTEVERICRAAAAEARVLDSGRRIEVAGEGPIPVRWDEGRIEQALSNLLGNAIKYGDGAIFLRWRAEGEQVSLEVENEGQPIDPRLLPRLFRPFQPGQRRDAPLVQSLGLGLYIVREIVRSHGGTATIESLPGGTRVRLQLPREAP